jgi:hypothetical protein
MYMWFSQSWVLLDYVRTPSFRKAKSRAGNQQEEERRERRWCQVVFHLQNSLLPSQITSLNTIDMAKPDFLA